jgi:hypothetical protein
VKDSTKVDERGEFDDPVGVEQVEFIHSHAPFEIVREEIVVNKAPGTTAPPSLLIAYRKTRKTALSWSISTERAHCPKWGLAGGWYVVGV